MLPDEMCETCHGFRSKSYLCKNPYSQHYEQKMDPSQVCYKWSKKK